MGGREIIPQNERPLVPAGFAKDPFDDHFFESVNSIFRDMDNRHRALLNGTWPHETMPSFPKIEVDLDRHFAGIKNNVFSDGICERYRSAFLKDMDDWSKRFDDYRSQLLPVHSSLDAFGRRPFQQFLWGPMDSRLFPQTRVEDRGDELRYSIDLGDLPKEDVRVNISDGSVEVTAEHTKTDRKEDSKGGVKSLMTQSYRSSFYKSFPLPDDVEESEVRAFLKNGKLDISMPKKDKRSIRVD